MKEILLNRYWRDVQAASMHITFNFDWLGEMFGKVELGITIKSKRYINCLIIKQSINILFK